MGGDVIGASIAYCLAARGADVIVIERSSIACAASGKSGGFLAKDWCDLRRGGDVVGVDLDGEALEGHAVVIAMGPW